MIRDQLYSLEPTLFRYLFISTFLRKKRYEQAREAIKTYPHESNMPEKKMVKDIIWCHAKYRTSISEYFLYRFYDLGKEERKTYISDASHYLYAQKMNRPENRMTFVDKALTYERFKKYYKRELIKISSENQLEEFLLFVEKNNAFITKPVDSAMGKGVRLQAVKKGQEKELFYSLLDIYKGQFVAEEKLIQSETLGCFHPESVNTVRIFTIGYKDRVDIIHAFVRFGRGKSVVDNGGSGGLMCCIEPSTGVITAVCDEGGHSYNVHPDTGCQIIGFTIPDWEDAKKLAQELALVVPTNHYTGWDLAHTDKGWVMVEGNYAAQLVGAQTLEGKGFKPEFDKILKDLKQ